MDGNPPGAIWPVTDFDGAQCREVYARFGLAMSQAQVLEHGMVNTMLVFTLMPTMRSHPDETSWQAAFDRFYDVELGKTFGNMLRGLTSIESFPAELLERLRAAKTDRDHLAHRFFREHDMDFMTREGRTRMIVECETLIEQFTELDHDIETFAEQQRQRYGFTKEWIDEKVDAMVAEAEAREGRG
ncbi:hypothetical protein [Sphingomonas oryzagri]